MLSLEVKDDEYIFSGRSMQITKDKNALLEPHGKVMKNYGVVLSLLPEEKQKSHINQQIGNARFVHNNYLEQRKYRQMAGSH